MRLHGYYDRITIDINRHRATEYFQSQMIKTLSGIGATRAALSQMLRSNDLVGWSNHEESGRLNRKALSRVAAGATTIFSRRESKLAERSAVTILVDCSGSMITVMSDAAVVTIQLAKMLEQAKVNLSVLGFTGSEPDHDTHDADTGAHEQILVTIPFKSRGESLRAAAAGMGAIRDCATAGNPDYAALMHAIEEISAQSEQRKIIFFLTDTGSYDRAHMRHAQNFADKMGVTLIAIGIGATVTRLFKHGADVHDIKDLGGKTFTTLLRTLRAKD